MRNGYVHIMTNKPLEILYAVGNRLEVPARSVEEETMAISAGSRRAAACVAGMISFILRPSGKDKGFQPAKAR